VGGQVGHILQQRRDIGKNAEQADGGEHADSHGEQYLCMRQGAEFTQHVGALVGFDHGDEGIEGGHRKHADGGDGPKCGAPPLRLAEQRAERHTGDIGKRQTREHQGNRLRPLLARHHLGRHHRADAEEGPMRQRGDHARGHQRPVAGGKRAQRVAQDEHAHQPQQRRAPWRPRRGNGDNWRPKRHRQRITSDQQPGARNTHAKIARHIRQQAHNDELGRADAESGDGQGQEGKAHAGAPAFIVQRTQ